MILSTIDDFNELLQTKYREYYIGRWEYYKEVIGIIKSENISSVLELGPGKFKVVSDCDIMVLPEIDSWGRPEDKDGKIIFHDATVKPWPINDKKYDLFIALQVWEHLSNKQVRAFREVIRTSKMAILSFPYLWDVPQNDANYPEHNDIDEDLIRDWTLNIKPEKTIKISRTGEKISKGQRIIYFWKFNESLNFA
jgi:hypothetical protein